MIDKTLKERWTRSENNKALEKIRITFSIGGRLPGSYSPFGLIDGLADFRGLDLANRCVRNLITNDADFSDSLFISAVMEDCSFNNVKFDRTDFTNFSEKKNKFNAVSFANTNFYKAVIGYQGSEYRQCDFIKANFLKTGFIRSEFNNCTFRECKLKGADFDASSFEYCDFAGKLEDVWFRGTFAIESHFKTFGNPRLNRMKNVSFKNAILLGVSFSDNCDLSTVEMPETGNYRLYDNWKKRLLHLKSEIQRWPEPLHKESDIFANSYLIHAPKQDWFLLNLDEIIDEFGRELSEKLILALG